MSLNWHLPMNYLRSLWQIVVENNHSRTSVLWDFTLYMISVHTVPMKELFKNCTLKVLFCVCWSFVSLFLGYQHCTFWRKRQCPFARIASGWSYKKKLTSSWVKCFNFTYPIQFRELGCSDLPYTGVVFLWSATVDACPFGHFILLKHWTCIFKYGSNVNTIIFPDSVNINSLLRFCLAGFTWR